MTLPDPQLLVTSLRGVAITCVALLILMRLIFGPIQKNLVRKLSEELPLIYRINIIPDDFQCVMKAEGAFIEAGDFGWEAEPLHGDGLIYLHGLNDRWQVVWYAGFKRDQLEIIGQNLETNFIFSQTGLMKKKSPLVLSRSSDTNMENIPLPI